MADKAYSLEFDGYWREPVIGTMPEGSGIYSVYACVHNAQERTNSLKRLLYIGEAGDVRGRVGPHEYWPKWKAELKDNEVICFGVAMIAGENDRQRAEAALIFKNKPPCNTEYVNAFPFDATSVTSSGKNKFLSTPFTVQRTAAASVGTGAPR